MDEPKYPHSEQGYIRFLFGGITGLLYCDLLVEIPIKDKLDGKNQSLFCMHSPIKRSEKLIDEYADAFEQISKQFHEWSLYLKRKDK